MEHTVMLRCVGCGYTDHFKVSEVPCSTNVGGNGEVGEDMCFVVDGASMSTGQGKESPLMRCPSCKVIKVGGWRVLGHTPIVREAAKAAPAPTVEEVEDLRDEIEDLKEKMAAADAARLKDKREAVGAAAATGAKKTEGGKGSR